MVDIWYVQFGSFPTSTMLRSSLTWPADVDLLSIVDSWQDTLPDEDILQLLKNWNAGRPLFETVYASAPKIDE